MTISEIIETLKYAQGMAEYVLWERPHDNDCKKEVYALGVAIDLLKNDGDMCMICKRGKTRKPCKTCKDFIEFEWRGKETPLE